MPNLKDCLLEEAWINLALARDMEELGQIEVASAIRRIAEDEINQYDKLNSEE